MQQGEYWYKIEDHGAKEPEIEQHTWRLGFEKGGLELINNSINQ